MTTLILTRQDRGGCGISWLLIPSWTGVDLRGGCRGYTPCPFDETIFFICSSRSRICHITSQLHHSLLVHLLPRKILYLPLRGGGWGVGGGGTVKRTIRCGILSTLKPKKDFHMKGSYIFFLIGIRILFYGCGASSLT